MAIDPRTPVLVGVGTSPGTSGADAEAVELMVAATQAAGADSGAPALLTQVQRIAVPRGTWSYTDPARIVADSIGAPSATTVLVDLGIPQQTIVDEVMAAMLAGDVDVAVVVGGEAKARAARLRNQSTKGDRAGMARVFTAGGTEEAEATETDQGGAVPDVHQSPSGDLVDPVEIEAGLWAPVEQYAMIENALAAAEGVPPAALRGDIASLYARFNRVAGRNPEAAFPEPLSADELASFTPSNRPLAFPYAKWHVTQWTVDQAAALLLCTAGAAERAGVPKDRWVFPVVGLSSSHMLPVVRRAELHRWPAMKVLGDAAAAHLGHPLSDLEVAELYSCFPVAVRVQQRELGLPADGTPTVTGGMAFAGGPFNSYVLQSIPAVVRRVREGGGPGLVTSVSGFLTKPGLGVWSTEPGDHPPLIADLAVRAAEATAAVASVPAHTGPATVATYTVTYDGQDPTTVVALCDTPDGERVVARTDEPAVIERAVDDGIIGDAVVVDGNRLTT
jgi:acetyl-CoA C-acetyltransferase